MEKLASLFVSICLVKELLTTFSYIFNKIKKMNISKSSKFNFILLIQTIGVLSITPLILCRHNSLNLGNRLLLDTATFTLVQCSSYIYKNTKIITSNILSILDRLRPLNSMFLIVYLLSSNLLGNNYLVLSTWITFELLQWQFIKVTSFLIKKVSLQNT